MMTCTGSSLVALLMFVVIPVLLVWVGYIVGHGRGEDAGFRDGYHQGQIDERFDIVSSDRRLT